MDRLLRTVPWRRTQTTGFRTDRIEPNRAPTVEVERTEEENRESPTARANRMRCGAPGRSRQRFPVLELLRRLVDRWATALHRRHAARIALSIV